MLLLIPNPQKKHWGRDMPLRGRKLVRRDLQMIYIDLILGSAVPLARTTYTTPHIHIYIYGPISQLLGIMSSYFTMVIASCKISSPPSWLYIHVYVYICIYTTTISHYISIKSPFCWKRTAPISTICSRIREAEYRLGPSAGGPWVSCRELVIWRGFQWYFNGI